MSKQRDLVIQKLKGMLARTEKERDELAEIAMRTAEENDKLTGLISEVKHALKNFKRAFAGQQTENLYNKIKAAELKAETEVMKSVVKNVTFQRTSRSGLHKVVRRYLAEKGMVCRDTFELEEYPEETFQAFVRNSHIDPGFALSVISAMLVVLMDEKEKIG